MSVTEIAKGFKKLNPGPLDEWYGPYANTTAACTAIPNIVVEGVNFRMGKTVGIITIDGIVEYYWKEIFTDAGLVPKMLGYAKTIDMEAKADKILLLSASKNLFNPADYDTAHIIDNTGAIVVNPGGPPWLGLYTFDINGAVQFTLSNQSDNDSTRLALYDENDSIISIIETALPYTFTTTPDTRRVRFMTVLAQHIYDDHIQLEKGNAVTGYVPYTNQIRPALAADVISLADPFAQGENLFNKETYDRYRIVNTATGLLIPSPDASNVGMFTIEKIKGRTSYLIANTSQINGMKGAYVVEYDDQGNMIVVHGHPDDVIITFTTTPVTRMVKVNTVNYGSIHKDKMVFKEGNTLGTPLPFYNGRLKSNVLLQKKSAEYKSLKTIVEVDKKFFGVMPSGFSNNLTDSTTTASGLVIIGGGNHNNRLYLNKYSHSREVFTQIDFRVNTGGVVEVGMGGDNFDTLIDSINHTGNNVCWDARFYRDGGANSGKLEITYTTLNEGRVQKVISTDAIVLADYEHARLTLAHFYDRYFASIEVIGDPSRRLAVGYQLPTDNTANGSIIQAISARPSIFVPSGNVTLTNFRFSNISDKRNITTAFLGDSISSIFSANGFENAYQFIASGGDYSKFTTISGPGFTTIQLIYYIAEVLELNPKYVFLYTGTNDVLHGRTPQQLSDDIEYLIVLLMQNGIQPVLSTLPRINATENTLHNNKIRALGAKYELKTIDNENLLLNDDIAPDQVHPNTSGHNKIGNNIRINAPELFI
ncbi:SGNH/GDSL hydrolase family protein [Pedobacter sp.]|uniref:SGNH/GDSL hydrolase family protein n=1 Tax=Pedobacter sp. TaxID=1411316 RepID=UPI0031D6D708